MSEKKNNLKPRIIRGCDPDSFAKYTIDIRFPHIINEIIRDNEFTSNSIINLENLINEVKAGEIIQFKDSNLEDSNRWNKYVSSYLGKSWYEVPFLFAEMYLYRRILEAIDAFNVLFEEVLDPFKIKKENSLISAENKIMHYAKLLNVSCKSQTYTIERLNLFFTETMWANSNDLSQMPEDINSFCRDEINSLSDFLLVNELSQALCLIEEKNKLNRIDIIIDNCGAELLADLSLVTYMLKSNVADKVFLHCKKYPVFVSDATISDVIFTLKHLKNSKQSEVATWGEMLSGLVNDERLFLCDNYFWQLPIPFRDMPTNISEIFEYSELIIFKGDVNYRRLVDDRYWSHDTVLQDITQYLPANSLVLRVLKSEVIVGLDIDTELYDNLSSNWMTEGKYGVIQYVESDNLEGK